MPLRDKVAQLIIARLGSNMHPAVRAEEDFERMQALLAQCPLGGLIVFNGDVANTPETLARLQESAKYPLLIGSDIERGFGQQFRGATVFPHAMAYSALDEDAEAMLEESARVTAREALACGVHVTFSPVADVNRNLANPIISTRAFATEPELAARLVRAYIRGCSAEGLLTAAKHFPGHGNTSDDSHETVPVVPSPRAELEALDLVPFRAAIAEGVDLVMTAHVAFPALDPTGAPATLSRPILDGLLRGELGFQGAVISDSMLMGAVNGEALDVGEQAAALLQAGADIILDPADPVAIVDGVLREVEAGRLDEARIDEALGRVTALKRKLIDRFGRDYFVHPAQCVPADALHAAEHRHVAERVARRAVHTRSTRDGMLPLDPVRVTDEGLLAILLKPWRSRLDPPEEPLGEAIRTAFPGARFVQLNDDAGEAAYAEVLAQAAQVRHVVVAMVVKPAAWRKYGLLPEQEALVHRLTAERPVILASLGTPYVLDAFPDAAERLCTFSDVAVSQEALAAALAGKTV